MTVTPSPSAPPHDEPSWLDVRGVRTALRRRGSGEPLLYLHGSGLTRRWLPIHESLAASFDVIAPEHPGYGDTVRPRWYRGLDDMALHYADLLSALGLESAHVVGHSMGGRIAGAFAGLFPERIRSLTLLTPAPLEPGGTAEAPPWADDEDLDTDELLFNGNQASYPDYLDGDDEGLIVAADDGADPHADPSAWSVAAPATLYRRLARLTCPTLVLAPDEDRVIPHACFDEWAAFLPGGRVVQIPGRDLPTTHLLIVQEPDAIAAEVRRVAGLG